MSRQKTEIGSDEFKSRVVDLCLKSGASGLPRRTRDRHIVLKSIALTLDPDEIMTADYLDRAIDRWIRLVAQRLDVNRFELRRRLVTEGYLQESPGGKLFTLKYCGWRPGFAVAVDELDVVGVALHGMCDIEQRRLARFPKRGSLEGKKIVKARMVVRQLIDGELDCRVACDKLRGLFDGGQPFLSDLTYFYCVYGKFDDDEGRVRHFAAEFLKKSDEWIRWLRYG